MPSPLLVSNIAYEPSNYLNNRYNTFKLNIMKQPTWCFTGRFAVVCFGL